MMVPQKFASVHYKSRTTARMVPFRDDTSLLAFRYENTKPAEPPILLPPPRNPRRTARPCTSTSSGSGVPPTIIIPPPKTAPPQEDHPLFRSQSAAGARPDEEERDSVLAPTSSSYSSEPEVVPRMSQTAQETITSAASREYMPTRKDSTSKKIVKALSMRSSASTKRLKKKNVQDDKVAPVMSDGNLMWGSVQSSPVSPKSPLELPPPRPPRPPEQLDISIAPSFSPGTIFRPITIPIPTESLLDEDLGQLSFSKRGSIMLAGKRPIIRLPASLMDRINDKVATAQDSTGRDATRDVRQVSSAGGSSRDTSIPKIRVLPADVERESQKVRSLYDSDGTVDWRDGGWVPALVERLEPPAVEAQSDEMENVATPSPVSGRPSQDPPSNTLAMGTPRSGRSLSPRRDSPSRREFELAGGLEDWEGVAGADVDRYGFISPKGWESVVGGLDKPRSARLSPTNENRLEMSTRPSSSPSASGLSPMRQPSRKFSARSLYTQASEYSNTSRRSARSTIRHATNRLPHNKGRRWVEEAGEMLTQIPGLADIEEDEQAGKLAEASKRKEWGRSEKWRKMAKVVKKSNEGEGTAFEFDTKNQKLIDRTWKGIPDCWRAAAWYSFLATSAKQVKSAETDEHLISEFHRLQEVGSPDDVQIDLDVPRTINRHIMFRRRYRGGQRLLFRVLHSISLYFPDTGYVQGMASLAATLLCYYDEERCFVMLVRMWRHRGLEYLYQAGFDGLMATLKEFENVWLEGKDVARKLNELSIDATAYATRWYLTLFNLSIPFPAQLRVWDVFMLLGEPAPRFLNGRETEFQKGRQTSSACYDVLHATSAALIDALRDVLLDSDFENAMKALTSWIPIKDEEMLMKVTRAEWKRRQGKKKS